MELKSKVDAMYGNENDDDIQEQPYILLKKRVTLSQAREYAKQQLKKQKQNVVSVQLRKIKRN